MKLSFEDEESLKEALESLRFNNPPSDPDTQQLGVESNNSMPLQDQDQERNEVIDICFNSPTSGPNTLRRMGSNSSMPPPQERSEEIEMVRRSYCSTY